MLKLHRGGKLMLKFLDVWPANECRGLDDVGNGGVNSVFDGQILSVEIGEGNVHGGLPPRRL